MTEKSLKQYELTDQGDEAKRIITHWLQNTSSHGVPKIFNAKTKFMKFLWLIVFLTGFSACVALTIINVIEFFKYKTTVSIEYLSDEPTDFPAVTFCNLYPLNEIRLFSKLFVSDKHTRLSSTYTHLLSTLSIYKCIENDTEYSPLWMQCLNTSSWRDVNNYLVKSIKSKLANSKLSTDDLYQFGFYLNETLLDCEYNHVKCNNDDFDVFWHNDHGTCFTFNSGKSKSIRKTNMAGSDYGLKLELFTSWFQFLIFGRFCT
jgi:hypothetical protein